MGKKKVHPKEVPASEEVSAEAAGADEYTAAIATLEKIRDAEVLDETLLEELNDSVSKLSEEGQRKFAEMPIIQRILERAGEESTGEPGTVKRVGPGDSPYSFKVPYSLPAVYEKWPVVEEFIADTDYTIVVPGGWVFKLHEDIIYDTPIGGKCAEGHGYRLPCIVVGIIRDMKAALRDNRRETQRELAFGMGVKYIGEGWAGKDNMGLPEGGEV